MADVTRRFRAESTIPYSHALITLAEYARERQRADFSFGPVGNVRAIVQSGLVITGPGAVVEALADLLGEQVPGLYEVNALEEQAAWR